LTVFIWVWQTVGLFKVCEYLNENQPSNIDSILIFAYINTLINTEIMKTNDITHYYSFFGWLLKQSRWRQSEWRQAFSQQLVVKRACSSTSHVKTLCTVNSQIALYFYFQTINYLAIGMAKCFYYLLVNDIEWRAAWAVISTSITAFEQAQPSLQYYM
jgi:hypothetical protein